MSFPDLGRLLSLSLFLVAAPRPCPVQGAPSSQFLNGGQRLRCGQAARRTPLVGVIPHGDRYRPPAAARIAVQLREYHVVEIETFVKFFRRIDGILTGHRIDYEQRLRRLDRRQDLLPESLRFTSSVNVLATLQLTSASMRARRISFSVSAALVSVMRPKSLRMFWKFDANAVH